jgi:hypothetical protein
VRYEGAASALPGLDLGHDTHQLDPSDICRPNANADLRRRFPTSEEVHAMALFALLYRHIDDPETVSAYRPEQWTYLSTLAKRGELLVRGPRGEPGPAGRVLVFDVDSVERMLRERIASENPSYVPQPDEDRQAIEALPSAPAADAASDGNVSVVRTIRIAQWPTVSIILDPG